MLFSTQVEVAVELKLELSLAKICQIWKANLSGNSWADGVWWEVWEEDAGGGLWWLWHWQDQEISLEPYRVPRDKSCCKSIQYSFPFWNTFFLYFQLFAFLSMSVVIISTITFLLSTLPQLATNLDLILFENKSGGKTDMPVERWEKVSSLKISFLKRKMP